MGRIEFRLRLNTDVDLWEGRMTEEREGGWYRVGSKNKIGQLLYALSSVSFNGVSHLKSFLKFVFITTHKVPLSELKHMVYLRLHKHTYICMCLYMYMYVYI